MKQTTETRRCFRCGDKIYIDMNAWHCFTCKKPDSIFTDDGWIKYSDGVLAVLSNKEDKQK